MKNKITVCLLLLVMACVNSKAEKQIVELSCGQCQFELTSENGCSLAVRIDDKAYFVDGADIDDFGDAHDKDTGFCEAIRKAEVTGEVIDDRFKVSTIELLD
jgi:hypothetical protein